eukprot:c10741_g2_i1 orf=93-269(+)
MMCLYVAYYYEAPLLPNAHIPMTFCIYQICKDLYTLSFLNSKTFMESFSNEGINGGII